MTRNRENFLQIKVGCDMLSAEDARLLARGSAVPQRSPGQRPKNQALLSILSAILSILKLDLLGVSIAIAEFK